jgi:hypothetical protein
LETVDYPSKKMKANEEKLREAIELNQPFTLVVTSGDRVKVRGREWIFLPPLADENGVELGDDERTDFFEVWGNGKRARWIAFEAITVLEVNTPV